MTTEPIKFVYYIADGKITDFSYAYNGDVGFDVDVADDVKAAVLNPDGTRNMQPNFAVLQDAYGNFTGAIRFNKAPVSGALIYIYRETPRTQDSQYETSSGFDAKSIEKNLDKITKILQEIDSHSKNKTVQLDTFQKERIKLELLSAVNNGQYLILDTINWMVKAGLFLEITSDNRFRVSKDGKTWIYLPKSENIQEIRQRVYLDDKSIEHKVFEYRVGSEWYDVLTGVSHTGLLDRDAKDSHPISAITNLQSELDKKANGADVYDKNETYSKEEVDTALGKKANASTTYSKTEVDDALAKKLNIQQGASNVGKILKVGEDGNIIASSEAAGLASVNHDDTLDGAGTDSSPLVVAGKEKLTNKITNCILQLPQNIKLTVNGNQLTLASGSTYYVPNGVGKFNAVTTSTDITYTPRSNGTRLLLMNSAGTNMDAPNIANCYSQESQPSGNSIYWWDLSNNLVKSIVSGSVAVSGVSLPIALLTVDGDTVTIEKVFNGVGFMGTTIYTTPDLLVAVPNGRNSDGTLNNNVVPQTTVNTYTSPLSYPQVSIVASHNAVSGLGSGLYYYDFETNYLIRQTGGKYTFAKIGTFTNNGTYITDIDLDEPFAAVDYNEYAKDLSHINETLEDKASISEPQTIGGKYTFTQTIDINNSLGMQINRALDSGGTTAWRVYDSTNSRQIRALGFYANSKIYNRLSIVGNTGIEGYLNFSMTDDGTMNIGLNGGKEYLPSKGANNSSFATTKWVQRELGDYAQNDLSNVSSNIDYVVESQEPTESNNYTWYRKYKSGWVEQGGGTGQSNYIFYNSTVTFPVPFADMNYAINGVGFTISNAGNLSLQTKTTTSFTVASDTQQCGVGGWFACGMAA